MDWKKERFKHFRLYAVTDLQIESDNILEKFEAVCRGGADILQLRSKVLSDAALLRIGRKLRAIAARYEKLFIVNDRVDLALLLEADGVHVGQDDMPVAAVRRLAQSAGHSLIVGKSTHAVEQARSAAAEGADYLGAGPVFTTPTKPDYPCVGLEYIRQVSREIAVPFVAIGGINLENARQVLETGARRLAVVRAVFEGEDNEQKTRRLYSEIAGYELCSV